MEAFAYNDVDLGAVRVLTGDIGEEDSGGYDDEFDRAAFSLSGAVLTAQPHAKAPRSGAHYSRFHQAHAPIPFDGDNSHAHWAWLPGSDEEYAQKAAESSKGHKATHAVALDSVLADPVVGQY